MVDGVFAKCFVENEGYDIDEINDKFDSYKNYEEIKMLLN